MAKDEVKYREVREARPKLRAQRELWRRVTEGVSRATVVVIDPGEVEQLVQDTLNQNDVEQAGTREKAIIEGCASEIVAGTPIAYLSETLARQLPGELTKISSLSPFAPDAIRKRLGGGLDKAMIFAARAHASFDVPRMGSALTTQGALTSPRLARVVLPEVLRTVRHFDTEHPASAELLNEAADEIARALEARIPLFGTFSPEPLVREVDSHGIDALQASDVASGWAREILETGDTQMLGSQFERVFVNGRRTK
jgi:hypothetical protein